MPKGIRRSQKVAVCEAEPALAEGWLPAVAADHDVRVLVPRGEVTQEGYDLIERACSGRLRLGGPRMVLDLSRVSHLDYRGTPALSRAAAKLRAEQGDLRLAGVSTYLETILRFVGLEAEFLSFRTAAEAVASFASPQAVLSAGG